MISGGAGWRPDSPPRRLTSWKEIADFLGRTVRTVQRWEREGLPVHRPLDSASGTVYAYTTELELWVAASTDPAAPTSEPAKVAFTVEERLVRGRHFLGKRTFPSMMRGIAEMRAAVDLDPSRPASHIGVAEAYVALYVNEWLSPADGMVRARAEAEQALHLEPGLATAHSVLGFVAAFHDGHWQKAERHFNQALARDSDCLLAHYFYGLILTNIGRFDESAHHLQRALEIDPLSGIIAANRGRPELCRRDYDQALRHFRRGLQIDPSLWLAYVFLGWAYEGMGRMPDAIACFEQALTLSEGATVAASSLAHAQALIGRRDEARAYLEWAARVQPQTYVSPVRLARIHVALGDQQAALQCLENAVRDRSLSTNVYPRFDPALAPLGGHPRFEACLARVGL